MITKKIKRIIYEYDDGSKFIDENPLPDSKSNQSSDPNELGKFLDKQKYTICRACGIDLKDMTHYCCARSGCPSSLTC